MNGRYLRKIGASLVVALVAALPSPPATAALPSSPGPGAVVARQAPANASASDAPIMLVVDTSGSMGDSDGSSTGRRKIEGARSALLNFIGGLPTSTVVGLRTYPGSGAGSCSPGNLDFNPMQRNPADMAARIRLLAPSGDTPTAEALEQAADDLIGGGFTTGTLVLVSDGLHTCADPCPAAEEIAASGLALSVITVGFKISAEGREELECIAEATDGVYVDADDNDALDEVLDDLTRPRLSLALSHPETVVADVGMGQGSVTIEAEVANTGQVEAPAVTAQLRFDDVGSAPGVAAPHRVLGNIAPGGEATTVRWQFQAGLILQGRTVRFSVIVRGRNLVDDVVETGSVSVVDATGRSDAGPLLSEAERIVIMGDSYSAGEGAHSYLAGTDTEENPCHRSRSTYMVEAFDIASEDILACSGAVSLNVRASRQHVYSSQVHQLHLRQAEEPVDAVVLTIGGNDAGFATVATSCLLGRQACHKAIYPKLTGGGIDAKQYLEGRFAGLATDLIDTYTAINDVLNDRTQVEARGGRFAPIVVLGYPRILPGAWQRSCPSMSPGALDLLTPDELAYIEGMVSRLNGVVEGAVKAAATGRPGARPLPVAFAPAVEDAFLPDHTVCDEERYANGLEDGRFWDDLVDIAGQVDGSVVSFVKAAIELYLIKDQVDREKSELLHPNPTGYAAVTRAVIRSSLADEAEALAGRLGRSDAFALGRGWSPPPGLDDLIVRAGLGSVTLDRGRAYRLEVEGLAPGLPALVTVESTSATLAEVAADDEGVVRTEVVVPESTASGRHHVVVYGLDRQGDPVRREVEVEVASAGPPILRPALLAGSLGLSLLGLLLRRRGRTVMGRSAPREPATP